MRRQRCGSSVNLHVHYHLVALDGVFARRLPGGCVAYRLRYVARGRRGKYRVMTGVEFLASLAAITCRPR